MSTITHTPGPWEADLSEWGSGDSIDITEAGAMIASVLGADSFPCLDDDSVADFDAKLQANAHLISAAPELLAALKGIYALIESGQLRRNTSDDPNPDFAMRQIPFVMALKAAQAAIEKAEGFFRAPGEWVCSLECRDIAASDYAEKLRRDVERLEREQSEDTKRLDALESNINVQSQHDGLGIYEIGSVCLFPGGLRKLVSEEENGQRWVAVSWRAAIDAARKENPDA